MVIMGKILIQFIIPFNNKMHHVQGFIWVRWQSTIVDSIDRMLEDRDAILDDLRTNLLRAYQKCNSRLIKRGLKRITMRGI